MKRHAGRSPAPFYWLRAGSWDDLWHLVPEFDATLRGQVLCPRCPRILRFGRVDRLLIYYARPKVALMGVYPCWQAVRLDLFKVLVPVIRDQRIHVGELALRDGTPCRNYRFLEIRNQVPIRGGPRVIVEAFDCGVHHLYRHNAGKVYLLRRDVTGLECVADRCSFYVSEKLLRRIRKAGIRGLRASPIPILEHPLDGLPEVLPD